MMGKLLCAQCRRIYSILDGIPVLSAERAELEAFPGSRLA
jgi:uncharacterized protein YbaR (Trm112 family)